MITRRDQQARSRAISADNADAGFQWIIVRTRKQNVTAFRRPGRIIATHQRVWVAPIGVHKVDLTCPGDLQVVLRRALALERLKTEVRHLNPVPISDLFAVRRPGGDILFDRVPG